MKKGSGVLLHLSSLPGYGIGGFGKHAFKFCDLLKRAGFTYWQILPLNTIGLGDSPYSGTSAFAGNFLYIDPEKLLADGAMNIEQTAYEVGFNSPGSFSRVFKQVTGESPSAYLRHG